MYYLKICANSFSFGRTQADSQAIDIFNLTRRKNLRGLTHSSKQRKKHFTKSEQTQQSPFFLRCDLLPLSSKNFSNFNIKQNCWQQLLCAFEHKSTSSIS